MHNSNNNKSNAPAPQIIEVPVSRSEDDDNDNDNGGGVGHFRVQKQNRTTGTETTAGRQDNESHRVSCSSIDWVAFCMVIVMMSTAALLLILTLLSLNSNLSHRNNDKIASNNNGNGSVNNGDNANSGRGGRALPSRDTDSLYKCELSYLQMDSSLIKFSTDHLIIVDDDDDDDGDGDGDDDDDGGDDASNGDAVRANLKYNFSLSGRISGEERPSPLQLVHPVQPVQSSSTLSKVTFETDHFELDSIDFNQSVTELLASTKLDPKLPFIFFINGFNTLNEGGEVSDTWMFDVAKNIAQDSRKRSKIARDKRRKQQQQQQHLNDNNNNQDKPMLLYRLFNKLMNKYRSKPPVRNESQKNGGSGSGGSSSSRSKGSNLRANVIFVTWSIPHIFADNVLAMIPAYYKTVANYDLVVNFVAETIKKSVRFVERSRSLEASGGASATNSTTTTTTVHKSGWSSLGERAKYYLGFEFYGHSLGSHILSDAIRRVRLSLGLGVKFGKLTGLDPATPCFLSVEHGISIEKVASSVNELIVVHSNAGFAGLTSERADIEIVLNGGTFQPGCPWYDMACHHSRSTNILQYRDDECQMVAYKCTSYHHFKTGACETCDQAPGHDLFINRARHQSDTSTIAKSASAYFSRQAAAANQSQRAEQQQQQQQQQQKVVRNCVLVNLPEQHLDSEQVLQFAEYNDAIRQLADNDSRGARAGRPETRSGRRQVDARRAARYATRQAQLSGRIGERSQYRMTKTTTTSSGAPSHDDPAATGERAKKAYYHYVNTSENFRRGRKSHCLQHYQLRLIMYNKNGDDKRIEQKCRPSKHLLQAGADQIRLALLYEPDPMHNMTKTATSGNAGGGTRRVLSLNDDDDDDDDDNVTNTPATSSNNGSGDGDGKQRQSSNRISLGAIIKDMLHTALLTIEREPKLFVGALVDNIDLEKLINCYVRENATSGPHFVLDVAFMSHTNQKVRHAYSSVLCGQLELTKPLSSESGSATAAPAAAAAAAHLGRISTTYRGSSRSSGSESYGKSLTDQVLMLNLCKQSELIDVSAQIDKLLNHIELHRLDETWKVSLLNNLFSLFAEWEPF